MKKKIRVVQIGTTHDHAADHMDTMRFLSDDYEIIGVCEPDDMARNLALDRISYDGLRKSYEGTNWLTIDEVLSMQDLDAVVIETSELQLVPYAQLFAEKGIAIHMDKPCGESYSAFHKLVTTMKEKQLPLHIGYMYRYNPAIIYCRDLIRNHQLGDVFSVEAQMSVLHDAEKREWLNTFKGGMMFFLGCHMIDIVYAMCGEPEEIIPYNMSTSNDGVQSLDYGFAVFKYPNGTSFVKTCASEVNGFDRRQIVVSGTKGTVRIEPIEDRTGGPNVEEYTPMHVTFSKEGMQHQFGKAGQDIRFGPFGRYLDMMKDFAEIVRGEKKNFCSYEDELVVHKMILQACGININS